MIAVDWQQPHQFTYDYSAREHHAVLGSLRDACRRFAIDTDRVFLTGHGIGGDAAWDIGLSHPDVWAGVIPIVGRGRPLRHPLLARTRQYVPWYFVGGELDGDKMAATTTRCSTAIMKPNVDTTVVEYLGRGYEPFGDEIQRLFDWMGRRRRTMPEEIRVRHDAAVGQFLLVARGRGLPAKSMVAPANWPPPRGTRPVPIQSKPTATQQDHRELQAEKTTVWLSPDLVDFNQPHHRGAQRPADRPRDRIRRAGFERAAGRRSHAGRSAAPVLGEADECHEIRELEC